MGLSLPLRHTRSSTAPLLQEPQPQSGQYRVTPQLITGHPRRHEDATPDDIYERVRGQLSEQEIVDLTYAVMAINGWNRLNVAFKTVPGSADAAFGLDKAGLK